MSQSSKTLFLHQNLLRTLVFTFPNSRHALSCSFCSSGIVICMDNWSGVRRIRVFFICQEEILYQPVLSTPDVTLRIQWRRQELLKRTRCCSGQSQGSITLAIETIIVGSYFQFCIDVVVLKSDVCKIFDLTVTKLYRWLSNCAPFKIQ